jgi:hypothetical protein
MAGPDGTYLVHKPVDVRSEHPTHVSRDSIQSLDLTLANFQCLFCLEQLCHAEQIASRLDLVEAELAHGILGRRMAAFRHVPTRTLRA